MKWYSVLSAVAILALASVAGADEFARRGMASPASTGLQEPRAPAVLDTGTAVAYDDYPLEAYPVGFSSYRGLGFQGVCCEQSPCGTESLWCGFCESRCRPRPGWLQFPPLFDNCHGAAFARCVPAGCGPAGCPATSCAPAGCATDCCPSPCAGPGANYWSMNSCLPPLGWRLKGCLSGLFGCFQGACEEGCCSGQEAAPTAAPAADPAPTPAPSAKDVPAPQPQADPAPVPPEKPAPAVPAKDRTTRARIPVPLRVLDTRDPTLGPAREDKSAQRLPWPLWQSAPRSF